MLLQLKMEMREMDRFAVAAKAGTMLNTAYYLLFVRPLARVALG